MKKRVLWTMLMALTMSCTMAVSAAAQDRDRDDQNHQADRDHDRNRNGQDDRWENRNGWEYRTYQGNVHPQGWHKGKKTGWQNCDDREGDRHSNCYTYQYQGQPYYYYRDENGRMIVRRQYRDHDDHHDNDHDHGHQ